jgi:DNA-binding Lrp family transcriptional regulator
MRTQPLFESWDCTLPLLPPRSRLYSLEPIGIGSPFVESLSGYIARLADAHSISVGNLVGRELSVLASSPLVHPSREQSASDSHGFCARSYAINGMGEASKRWVEAVEAGTMRADLRFLTLLPFENAFWSHALFRYCRVWCPACYEDSRAGGRIVHEPLLWAFKLATFCPQHRQPLEKVCPHCFRPQKPLSVFLRPGYCSKCHKWLGHSRPDVLRPACDPSGTDAALWYAEQIGELLGAAPRLDSFPLRESLTVNFRACVTVVAEGHKRAFASAAKISADTVNSLMAQTCWPTIPTLLRISYHLKIPVMTFLRVESTSAVSHWQEAQGRIQKDRLPSARASENIQAALERATSEQPPPRLSDVARRLNYIKLDRLYRVDRKLCRQIASNYQNSIRGCRRKPSDKRFCSLSKMQRSLEASLAKKRPTSPYHVALSLGFVGERTLNRKFPDLCREIQKKIDARKALDIASMERALIGALAEDPPPSLGELCERMGYSRPVVLRRRFSILCDQLLERRRAYRAGQIMTLKKRLDALSLEPRALSLEQACKRVGLSRQRLVTLCPEESAAIVARYERSRREGKQRRIEKLNRRVPRIVKKLYREGKCPSHRRVTALLGKSTSRSWVAIAAALKTAKRELNAAPPHSR